MATQILHDLNQNVHYHIRTLFISPASIVQQVKLQSVGCMCFVHVGSKPANGDIIISYQIETTFFYVYIVVVCGFLFIIYIGLSIYTSSLFGDDTIYFVSVGHTTGKVLAWKSLAIFKLGKPTWTILSISCYSFLNINH